MRLFLFLSLCLVLSLGWKDLRTPLQLKEYSQHFLNFPILHFCYSHKFRTSQKYEDLVANIEEIELKHAEYFKIVTTNCDTPVQQDSELYICKELKAKKESILAKGYAPSSRFINWGTKKIQHPPITTPYTPDRPKFTLAEMETFLYSLTPLFWEQLLNYHHYTQWRKPKYSPHVVYATRDEEFPSVLGRIGVHFYKRLDLGWVSDLTSRVVNSLNITHYPALLVITHDYERNETVVSRYPGREFTQAQYSEIRDYLEQFALSEPRNDQMYISMKMPQDRGIQVADSKPDYERILDRAEGLMLVSKTTAEPRALHKYREKFGRYFQYLHYNAGNETEDAYFYLEGRFLEIVSNEDGMPQIKTLDADGLLESTRMFLDKNYVIMVVREEYGHVCSLQNLPAFEGIVVCLVIEEEEYLPLSKRLEGEFDIGQIMYFDEEKEKKQVAGQQIKSVKFEELYKTLSIHSQHKFRTGLEKQVRKPVRAVTESQPLLRLCDHPVKRCILLFTHPDKPDRTAFQYLEESAINYVNEFQFFEVDLSCNPHLMEEIPALQKSKGGLVAVHPYQQSYVALKARLAKSTYLKFLKANLKDSRSLPLLKLSSEEIEVKVCTGEKEKETPQKEQEVAEGKSSPADRDEALSL